LCIQVARPQARTVQPTIFYVIGDRGDHGRSGGSCSAQEARWPPMEVLRSEPENGVALAQWHVGNIFSFAQAETVTLFGVVLKFLGAS